MFRAGRLSTRLSWCRVVVRKRYAGGCRATWHSPACSRELASASNLSTAPWFCGRETEMRRSPARLRLLRTKQLSLPDRASGGAGLQDRRSSRSTVIRSIAAAGRRLPTSSRRFRRISRAVRSEEHTSELQSLMRISYAVFCLKKKKQSVYDTNK